MVDLIAKIDNFGIRTKIVCSVRTVKALSFDLSFQYGFSSDAFHAKRKLLRFEAIPPTDIAIEHANVSYNNKFE